MVPKSKNDASWAFREFLKERVQEADKALGGLTDQHLKWLVGYTRLMFKADHVKIGVDLPNRTIYLTPYNGAKMVVGLLYWCRARYRQWRKRDVQDLPKWLGIPEWTICFTRNFPKETVNAGD
jgi:hypothetical protein